MTKKDLEQQLAEELLKSALLEDAMEFVDQLPSDEDLKAYHTFASCVDKRAEKNFKNVKRKQMIKNSFRYARKSVAIFLICFGLMFASLFSVRASRQYIIKAIWTLKDNFLELEYEKDGVKDKDYQMMKPTYIPMGYTQIDHYDEGFVSDEYKNDEGEQVILNYMPVVKAGVTGFNTDGYDIEDVMIGEYVGRLFVSQENGMALVWNDGVTEYIIDTSYTDKDEILKIARSYR